MTEKKYATNADRQRAYRQRKADSDSQAAAHLLAALEGSAEDRAMAQIADVFAEIEEFQQDKRPIQLPLWEGYFNRME
jgi:hypothetical protein